MSQPTPPTSNRLIDNATNATGQPSVRIESNGTPEMTRIRLSDNRSLGLVQKASWSMEVGEYARLTVETIAAPADLTALLRDTTIVVRPAPGYGPFRYLADWAVAKARHGWLWLSTWLYRTFTRPDKAN